MNEGGESRQVEKLAGNGWLRTGEDRIGRVRYVVTVYEVRTARDGHIVTGTEISVWLHNHAVPPYPWLDQLLTLTIADGRAITGFLTEDGARLVRTGALT